MPPGRDASSGQGSDPRTQRHPLLRGRFVVGHDSPAPHGDGTVLIVGGAEDREDRKLILDHFRQVCGGDEACILVIGVASEMPDEIVAVYDTAFRDLGVREVRGITARNRSELLALDVAPLLEGITGVYFGGGDQLRICAILGGTLFHDRLQALIAAGLPVGGTSAGASAISDTMIIGWDPSDQPLADNIRLSSGLGILQQLIIDQHFTERSRLSRLITSVAYHPGYLGIGIDEDTAAICTRQGVLSVIGSGTVTIVDGSEISECNVVETPSNHPFSVIGMKIHVLSTDHHFDLLHRRPLPGPDRPD